MMLGGGRKQVNVGKVASHSELGAISSVTLCREEFAARGCKTEVGPPTDGVLSMDGRCLSVAGGPLAIREAAAIR